jgi:hypothetical protein
MYFHHVIIKDCHFLYKSTIKLLIIASVLCVLFGNGTHIHSVFDHFSDHGDLHSYVHAHPADSNHSHNRELDDKGAHQHPTATIDLAGTLIQKASSKVIVFSNEAYVNVEGVSIHFFRQHNPVFLDLPPPDFILSPEFDSSLSLRGPPLG